MAMKARSQRMRVDRISERGTREASKEVTIKLCQVCVGQSAKSLRNEKEGPGISGLLNLNVID